MLVPRPPQTYPVPLFASTNCFVPGQKFEDRFCYSSTMYFIENGKGILQLNGTEYPLEAGMQIYIDAGLVHGWHSDSKDTLVFRYVFFDWAFTDRSAYTWRKRNDFICEKWGERWPGMISPPAAHPLVPVFKIEHPAEWRRLHSVIAVDETIPLEAPEEWLLLARFYQFLQHIMKYSLVRHRYIDPRIRQIVHAMEAFPPDADLLQVYALSARLGLQRAHFHHLFKAYTGTSPKQYMLRKKLALIQEELRHSPLTATEIAEKFGFTSIHYFTRFFKTMCGETPTDYRARMKI